MSSRFLLLPDGKCPRECGDKGSLSRRHLEVARGKYFIQLVIGATRAFCALDQYGRRLDNDTLGALSSWWVLAVWWSRPSRYRRDLPDAAAQLAGAFGDSTFAGGSAYLARLAGPMRAATHRVGITVARSCGALVFAATIVLTLRISLCSRASDEHIRGSKLTLNEL